MVGSSGSGKTKGAQAISSSLSVLQLELDSVFHQPGWTPLPTDEFQEAACSFTDQKAWVVDGNDTRLGISDVVWSRADTVGWLDLSRAQTMQRAVGRRLRRIACGKSLRNENHHGWLNLVDPRPDDNVIPWTWTRYDHMRADYGDHFSGPQWLDLTLVHLTSQTEVDGFVSVLKRS